MHSYGLQLGNIYLDTWPRELAVSCVGVLVLVAAPWLTHGVLGLDRWLLPRLLGPSESSLRIRELEENRLHTINEAASTLRRIERDLHDGVQARLGQLMGASRSRAAIDALSPREREVLSLMAQGRSNAAIAQDLTVTERAVEKHVANIFTRLVLPVSAADHRRVLAVLRYLGV